MTVEHWIYTQRMRPTFGVNTQSTKSKHAQRTNVICSAQGAKKGCDKVGVPHTPVRTQRSPQAGSAAPPPHPLEALASASMASRRGRMSSKEGRCSGSGAVQPSTSSCTDVWRSGKAQGSLAWQDAMPPPGPHLEGGGAALGQRQPLLEHHLQAVCACNDRT